ncbi:MAG: hypothetical protein M3Y82_05900 [Verrucomicrobiota bacterium]|nr:hypothetical protein [Verrucomicrobiota bacterium]
MHASEVTLLEISRDPNAGHREKLLGVLKRHTVIILPAEPRDEIEGLARKYIERKIIPATKLEDALHVAYAVVHQMDILLSWNFKHLANIRRETLIIAASKQEGYRHPLRLISPLEVEDETNED